MYRAILSAVVLASLSGCQRLSWSETRTLSPKQVAGFEFTAPAYDQRVKVDVKPVTVGVSAYLVKKSDEDAANKALDSLKGEPPASILLGSRVSNGPAEAYSFEATIPAKVPYVLLLRGGKKTTEVSIKVVGR